MKLKKKLSYQISFSFLIILLLWGSMPLDENVEMKLTVTVTLMIFTILNIILSFRNRDL